MDIALANGSKPDPAGLVDIYNEMRTNFQNTLLLGEEVFKVNRDASSLSDAYEARCQAAYDLEGNGFSPLKFFPVSQTEPVFGGKCSVPWSRMDAIYAFKHNYPNVQHCRSFFFCIKVSCHFFLRPN